MRVYHCDGPDCDARCSPDISNGWTKIKWSHYVDCSIHTGWMKDDTRYYCPECSTKLKAFLDPIKPNDTPIDLTKCPPVATGTFNTKEEKKYYDKGYIWE